MRKFNTTGPCFPDEHYMLSAVDRLPGIRELVSGGDCFVIHAPRQTGKTTVLKALVREINAQGEMLALYCSLEALQGAVNVNDAMPKLRLMLLESAAAMPGFMSPGEDLEVALAIGQGAGGTVSAVSSTLTSICRKAFKGLESEAMPPIETIMRPHICRQDFAC